MPYYKEDDSYHTYLNQDTNEGFTNDGFTTATSVMEFLKTNWIIVSIAVLVFVALLFFLFKKKKTDVYSFRY